MAALGWLLNLGFAGGGTVAPIVTVPPPGAGAGRQKKKKKRREFAPILPVVPDPHYVRVEKPVGEPEVVLIPTPPDAPKVPATSLALAFTKAYEKAAQPLPIVTAPITKPDPREAERARIRKLILEEDEWLLQFLSSLH